MKNKRLIGILFLATLLLLVPLIVMQFTNEVNWGPIDFTVAGILLYGTGLACEFVMRKINTIEYRIFICGAILVAFVLIWIELAVGIFGSPIAGS